MAEHAEHRQPRSVELHRRALAVMLGGNTRTSYVMEPFAPYAVRGQGLRIADADGVEYLAFGKAQAMRKGGLWV